MFYISVTEDNKIKSVSKNSKNALEYDASIEDLFKLFYDKESNTIYAREVVDYIIDVIDGKAVVHFDCESSLSVKVDVIVDGDIISTKEIFVERASYVDDETLEVIRTIEPSLIFDCEVNATIRFESSDKNYCFEPFYVEATELVDDDVPKVTYTMNSVVIKMSSIQRQVVELRKELEALRNKDRGDLDE